MHADACRAHVHGVVVVVERRQDADALSWNSKGGRCGTHIYLSKALAVFVRYPTRIAHGSGMSRRLSPDLCCNLQQTCGTLSGNVTVRTPRQRSSLYEHPGMNILGTATTIVTTKADLAGTLVPPTLHRRRLVRIFPRGGPTLANLVRPWSEKTFL